MSIQTLSQIIKADFKRIQFTPDLLPTDIVGTLIYNPQTAEFVTKQGPVFANMVLADEINRAPAKVQSALLECMQERQVTIGDSFLSLAQAIFGVGHRESGGPRGTYPLLEAQMDRFMLKMKIGYPTFEEKQISIVCPKLR